MKITIISSSRPTTLTKHITRDAEGKTHKTSSAHLTEGAASVVDVATMAELNSTLDTLQTNQAVAYGITSAAESRLVSNRLLPDNPGAITRSDKHFAWPRKEGVMMLDYDPAGSALCREGLLSALFTAIPVLAGAPWLWRPSASGCLYDTQTGEEVEGIRGQRVYLGVKDASDIPRAGLVLFKRLWIAGGGRIEIAANGAQLVRGLVDQSVWQPSRLDFAAGATTDNTMARRPPAGMAVEGAPLDTRSALPDLTDAEESRFAQLVHSAREQAAPEAAEQREQHVQTVAQTQGVTPEEVRARYEVAENSGVLGNDFPIEMAYDGGTVTVAEILKDPARYHNKICLDPLEPEYNNRHPVGKIFNDSKGACIDSKAHGGRVFILGDIAALTFKKEAGDGSKFKALISTIRVNACDLSALPDLLAEINSGPFGPTERVLLKAQVESELRSEKLLTNDVKALLQGTTAATPGTSKGPQVIGPSVSIPEVTELRDLKFKRLAQSTSVHGQNAEAIIAEVFGNRLSVINGSLRWWSGRSWDEVDDDDLKRHTMRALSPLNDKMPNVNGTVDALRVVCPVQPPAARDRRIYFKNCVYDVDTGNATSHHRDNGNMGTLSIDLDHNAASPQWFAFMALLFGGTADEYDRVALLQEILGWAMLRDDLNVQKVIALDGASRAGKGVVLEVLQEVLGMGVSGTASFQNLDDGKTQSAFIHKDVMLDYEAKPPTSYLVPQCIGFLNKLASNEPVSVQLLRKQKPWEGRLNAKYLIACNGIPLMMDSSGASANRFQVLMFTRSFYQREDFGLSTRLKKEAAGIARWALEGARRLVANGGRFTQPETSKEAAADLHSANKPMDDFISDHVLFGPDERCIVPDLWSAYRQWMGDTGTKPCSKAVFLRSFRQSVLDNDAVERRDSVRINGKVSTGFVGISIRNMASDTFAPQIIQGDKQ